jgi:hypothetical protein
MNTLRRMSRDAAIAMVSMAIWLGGAAALADTPNAPTKDSTAIQSHVEKMSSVPIELPDAPPHQGELVGGFVVELVIAVVLVILIVGVVLAILEGTHHHVVFHTCEECYHHEPAPPPPPPPAQQPPPPDQAPQH